MLAPESLPSTQALHAFLKDLYLHSRFEGRNDAVWGEDYADCVTRSTMEHLAQTGRSCVSMYESRTGRVISFDAGLNILNPDEPPAQIQARPGSLTGILGGSQW